MEFRTWWEGREEAERAGGREKRGIGTSWTFRSARRIQDANVEFSRQVKVLGLGSLGQFPVSRHPSSLLPSPTAREPEVHTRAHPPSPPRTDPPVPNWGSVTFGLAPATYRGAQLQAPLKSFCPTSPSDIPLLDKTNNSELRQSFAPPRKPPPHSTPQPRPPSWPASPTRPASTSSGPPPSSANSKTRKYSPRYTYPPPSPPPPHPKLTPSPFPGRNPLPRHQALRPRTHHPLPGRQALRLPRLRRLGALPRPPAHQALRAPPHPPIHLARQPRPHLFHL